MVDLSSSLCERLPEFSHEKWRFTRPGNPMLPVDPMPQKAPPHACEMFLREAQGSAHVRRASGRLSSAEQRRSVGLRGRGFPMKNGGFMGKS